MLRESQVMAHSTLSLLVMLKTEVGGFQSCRECLVMKEKVTSRGDRFDQREPRSGNLFMKMMAAAMTSTVTMTISRGRKKTIHPPRLARMTAAISHPMAHPVGMAMDQLLSQLSSHIRQHRHQQ